MLNVFSLKNPGRGFVLTVFALKNPGEGCVDRVRSQKTLVRARVDRDRSQKPWWGCLWSLSKTLVRVIVGRVRSQNPDRVDRVLSKKIYRGSVDLEEHILARRTTGD